MIESKNIFMDQLSAIVYRYAQIRDEVEKVIKNSPTLSDDQKDRWKGMLFLFTKDQLGDLKSLLIKENSALPHPADFQKEEEEQKAIKD